MSISEKNTVEQGLSAERTVQTITAEIKVIHRNAQQVVLGAAIEIGQRLVEVKELLPHGSWGDYLKAEVGYSQSTAQNFMRIFEEYGSDQIGLFGGEANSQALGNLTYTKALALLALPAEEREEFVSSNDVEGMSSREVQAAIRERDEARKELAAAEARAAQLAEVEALYDEMLKETQTLTDELKELRARPVEVVGASVPDEASLAAARAEGAREAEAAAKAARATAEEKLKKKIDAAEAARVKAEGELNRLKREQESAGASADAEREAAVARAAALEKQLAVAGSVDVTTFKIYFEAMQEDFNRMLGCVGKLAAAGDVQNHNKLRGAMLALTMKLNESIPAAMDEPALAEDEPAHPEGDDCEGEEE